MNSLIDGHWLPVRDGDPRVAALFERHYSCTETQRRRRHRRGVRKIMGPGEYLLLMTVDCRAIFAWRKARRPDRAGQSGVYCAIFRNEASDRYLSSDLVREACLLAWRRWPGERLFTYVDPSQVASVNPGYCFKVTGWRECGQTQVNKLVILECYPWLLSQPDEEPPTIENPHIWGTSCRHPGWTTVHIDGMPFCRTCLQAALSAL